MHYYLLLYKIKGCELFWIVKRDLHYYDLIDKIEKFNDFKLYRSDIDEYYIIKQNNCNNINIDNLLEIKQFTKYKLNRNSELIFKTK